MSFTPPINRHLACVDKCLYKCVSFDAHFSLPGGRGGINYTSVKHFNTGITIHFMICTYTFVKIVSDPGTNMFISINNSCVHKARERLKSSV